MEEQDEILIAGVPIEPNGELDPPPTEEDLRALIDYAGVELPAEYLDVMRRFDGIEAWFGDEEEPYLVVFDSCRQILETNAANRLKERGSPLLAVGGDGGGEAFAIDLETGEWVVVNWVDIGDGEHEIRFANLRTFLDACIADTVFDQPVEERPSVA